MQKTFFLYFCKVFWHLVMVKGLFRHTPYNILSVNRINIINNKTFSIMRKFYLTLVSFFMTLVCSLTANAITVTVKVDNPEAVSISVNYTPISAVEQINVLDVPEYSSVSIAGKDGYRIMGVTNVAGTPVGTLYASSNNWYNYISSSNEGDEYLVSTVSNEEYRDASCTIQVDVAANVMVRRSGTYEVVGDLKDNEAVTVWYNSQQELPLEIGSASRNPLYQVLLNGEPVPASGNIYKVTPAKGDKIVVESKFPDKDCKVKFVYVNEGTEGFVTGVSYDSNPVENYNAEEGFVVKAGKWLEFNANIADYKFNAMTVGSEQATSFYGSSYSTLVKDDLTITIDVQKYKEVTATLNVNDKDGISLLDNMYDTNSAKALESESTVLVRSENSSTIYLMVNSGYYIKSITAGGNDMSSTYNSYYKCYIITLTDGMVIDVDVAPIVRDQKAVVYMSKAPSSLIYFNFAMSDRSQVSFAQGYNELLFCEADSPFSWTWYDNGYVGEVYINDVKQAPAYEGTANYDNRTLSNGDVLKIYVGETDVPMYKVSFTSTQAEGLYTVTKDIYTAVESPESSETSVLRGTRISIQPVAGKSISVSAGDTELEAVDGVFTYDVDADVVFSVTNTTGLEVVDGEASGREVYNLQGMRMSGKLRPGMYIVNGKTTVVR